MTNNNRSRSYYSLNLQNEPVAVASVAAAVAAAVLTSGGNTEEFAKSPNAQIKLSKETYASDTELVANYAPTSRMVYNVQATHTREVCVQLMVPRRSVVVVWGVQIKLGGVACVDIMEHTGKNNIQRQPINNKLDRYRRGEYHQTLLTLSIFILGRYMHLYSNK